MFKLGINLVLIATLITIFSQNVDPVDVRVLAWDIHVPLVLLLLIMAVLGAAITFIFVLLSGR